MILLVLDSVGVGEMPDAASYGDEGSATLPNVAEAAGGLTLPNLEKLGLGNIAPIAGVDPKDDCRASWGKMAEKSPGKDTTTGHWEMMGLILKQPFPLYPNGFPKEVIESFQGEIGLGILGNKPASGTVIIEELGEEHIRTGFPIVYTSGDSVFQIAAHEDVIAPEKLYDMCLTARDILQGEHGVGRVIARPFVGSPGSFTRTGRRRDFSLAPLEPTLLEHLVEADHEVVGIGKISDIFAGQGVTHSIPTQDNQEAFKAVIDVVETFNGTSLIFANFGDFDSLWGHRNDPLGYAKGLEKLDKWLPELLSRMRSQDVLILTADHGCDPTTPGTDHSREYVPLLVTGFGDWKCTSLGIRDTFADIAAFIADVLGLKWDGAGCSFKNELGRPTTSS